MCKYLVKKVRRDIIFIVSTQTKVELEHKVWLCLYQLKKRKKGKKKKRNIEENAIYLTALIQR